MYEHDAEDFGPSPRAKPATGVEPSTPRPPVQARANALLDPRLTWLPGNRCSHLRDGVEAFPAMLDAIRGAHRWVRLESYIFGNDAVGELFGRTLAEAAERGVQVTVVYDALGSWGLPRQFVHSLRARGVKIRAFNPFSFRRGFKKFMRRDHRKLLVVDGEVAFVGGLNIAAQWAPKGEGGGWRDDVLRIEGPAVGVLERCFCATWRVVLNERLRKWRRGRQMRLGPAKGSVALSVLSSRRSIHRAYLAAIESARKSIVVAAGYFVPDRRILKALKAAAARGVDVRLVLAGKSDHWAVQFATRALYDRLLRWGLKVYEWHDCVLHSKTAVVDGTWATVGSFNLEPWSLLWNHEMNVVVADRRVARTLERTLLDDASRSEPIVLETWRKRPVWQKALERFFSFVSRLF
jgi:cardiolipin synthase A/B